MSRAGDFSDTAVAESFFATLRAKLSTRDLCHGASGGEAISLCIENFSNVERRHSHLDDVSPIEFEWKTRVAASAASSTCSP